MDTIRDAIKVANERGWCTTPKERRRYLISVINRMSHPVDREFALFIIMEMSDAELFDSTMRNVSE